RVFIEDNTISLVGKHGIGFNFSEDVFVKGNSIQGINQVGLWSYGATDVVMENNTVKDTNRAQVSVATRADIMVGSDIGATSTIDSRIVVRGNLAGSLRVANTNKTVVSQNIVGTLNTATANTALILSNDNLIG